MIQEPYIEGRNTGEIIRACIYGHFEDPVGLGLGNQDNRQPPVDAMVHDRRKPGAVKNGEDPHQGFPAFLGIKGPGPKLLDINTQVFVGEHDPFGDPGGTAGIEQGGQIIKGTP